MTIRGEISTEKIVEFLLSKECQFEVGEGDKKAIVAFAKGDWMVYQKDNRLFIVNECCDIGLIL
jgi:hypothetical protein